MVIQCACETRSHVSYRTTPLFFNVNFYLNHKIIDIFFSGILVIVALLFCTPYLYYIPKAALAAIIIAAVIFMVEVRVVRPIYRSKSKYTIFKFVFILDVRLNLSSSYIRGVLYQACT